MLYIVSTPIGNLEDISPRALKVLQASDAVLCEDTRRTKILMERYGLKTKLISYHKFNEAKFLEKVIQELDSGKNLSLVSDAGTPCINDPGERLVAECIKQGIPFTAIPGPCSLITALVLSGFKAERFQFIGYLPKQGKKILHQSLFYPGVTIAFESPQRLISTLTILHELCKERHLAVAREMTKIFEECKRGTAKELLSHFSSHLPKGEIVLLIGPGEPPELPLDLEECVTLIRDFHGVSLKEAIKLAAKLLKQPKRSVYKKMHG